MNQKIEISYEIVDRSDLSDAVKSLLNSAEQALLTSHAPYSKFHVGAALLLDDDTVIAGSNQENASYPIGYCAERTALAAKIAQKPETTTRAIGIAIMHKGGAPLPPIAPCGMCRQALLEEELRQDAPIKVYMAGNDGKVLIVQSISELLPFQFNGKIFA